MRTWLYVRFSNMFAMLGWRIACARSGHRSMDVPRQAWKDYSMCLAEDRELGQSCTHTRTHTHQKQQKVRRKVPTQCRKQWILTVLQSFGQPITLGRNILVRLGCELGVHSASQSVVQKREPWQTSSYQFRFRVAM